MKQQIVVSGIRPTGKLHLGNYFGAIRNFVRMQDEYKCFFFIADYHSLTTHPKAEELSQNVRHILAEYIAAGIDPEKATLYVQSDVPEVCELYLLLNMIAGVGELQRTASFKDKVRLHPENVNAGLLTYPVLMAADILMHRADLVPVGKDQEQHLEIARVFARRFNNNYNVEIFNEPAAFNFGNNLVKVPGLDGSGKMGKSEGNGLYLTDEPADILKKVKRAVTDTGPTEKNQTPPEVIENLFTLMNLVSAPEIVSQFRDAYADCSIRYGDMKKQLGQDIINFLAPIRERYQELVNNSQYLDKVAKEGKEKARLSAQLTLKAVRDAIGLGKL